MSIKIRHVILGKANPNRMNGVNKVVNSLAENQSKLGYDVGVWGITSSLEQNYPERNYSTRLFPSLKNKFTIASDLSEACNTIEAQTIMHIHGGFIPEFYHVAKKLNELSVPYVYTPHGAYNKVAMERSKIRKYFYFQFFDKYIAENAKAVHCIGQSEVVSTKRLSEKINCALIPNGQEIIIPENIADDKQINAKIIFGFCGRIDVYTKGLDLLFDAFIQYRNEYNLEGELWIIGDGTELSSLKAIAKQNKVEEDVIFYGKRFGDEKLNLMSQMDVFFHPSRNEGLPGAVLEAASLSVPCVVSKESNMSEYINSYNAGIGLAENNTESIRSSMQKLQNAKINNSINELKTNASKMVKKEFDWSYISKQLIALYQS